MPTANCADRRQEADRSPFTVDDRHVDDRHKERSHACSPGAVRADCATRRSRGWRSSTVGFIHARRADHAPVEDEEGVLERYPTALVAPFCLSAVKAFFDER